MQLLSLFPCLIKLNTSPSSCLFVQVKNFAYLFLTELAVKKAASYLYFESGRFNTSKLYLNQVLWILDDLHLHFFVAKTDK
jgi:hypothetical protein